ncbi:MAG: hypothetical protein ACREXY_21925, partial [Gammaproteobacteria bacterium]
IYSYFGFMAIVMVALLDRQSALLHLPARLRRLPFALAIGFGLLGVAGVARAALAAVLFERDGVSFAETRRKVRELENTLRDGEQIGFVWLARPSFVAFSRAHSFLAAVSVAPREDSRDPFLDVYEQRFRKRVRYLLLPQLGHVASAPPTLNAGTFLRVDNSWTSNRARLFGFKLGGATPGYQFALYRRIEPGTTQALRHR